jgi:hypothetical protein
MARCIIFCRQRLGETMSKVISVCDREADIFIYLQDKQKHNERLVIRAKHLRKIEGLEKNLFEHLNEQPELGGYTVNIPLKGMKNSKGKRINRVV